MLFHLTHLAPIVPASRWTIFLLGAASAGILKRVGRPIIREVVKGGILLGREAQTFADGVRQDWEDIVAEARAQIDGKPEGTSGNGRKA